MKSLDDIIAVLKNADVYGDTSCVLRGLTLNSKEVQKDWLFAAIKGSTTDGYDYIDNAIASGASVILCGENTSIKEGICYIRVPNPAHALGLLSSAFYNFPSKELKLVGITGTNGKTSVATLLYESFLSMGHKAGLLSTIKYAVNSREYISSHTTPNSVRINELLAQMRDQGCEYAFMEVSSHALDQYRSAGLHFSGAVFTNITHDHLDYHKDFKSYLYTKKRLFDDLESSAFALYNRDDRNGAVLVQNTKAVKYTYGLKSMSDFKTRIIESDFEGMLLDIRGDEVWLKLVGEFNAYNILAVYATAFLLGKEHFEIIKTLSLLSSVNGRFQPVKHAGITAIVDYAHTPDALQNVLDTINAIRSNNEQLICVLGCGGNRDKEKRPVMARIAGRHADRVIFTSDNPRMEDPEEIISDMMKGLEPQHYKKVLQILNREEAIKAAVTMSKAGDLILLAGKGHETYQEIKGTKYPFDDREILLENLKLIHN